MSVFAVLCCVLILGACDQGATAPTASLNADFTLAPGQTVTIESTATTVHFDRVVQDSRCPTDVQCIRAGEAIVRIVVKSSSGAQDYELNSERREPVHRDDLTITLVEVKPPRVSTRPIAPDEYRVTLRVTK